MSFDLQSIKKFCENAKTISGVAALLPYLTDKLVVGEPPWPEWKLVRFGTVAIQAAVFVTLFLWLKRSNRCLLSITLSAIVLIATVATYVGVYGAFVVRFDDPSEHQIVVGLNTMDTITEWRESQPAPPTDRDLLESFERDPEAIWTRGSLLFVRYLLLGAWWIGWGAVAAFAAGLAVILEKSKLPLVPTESKLSSG